MGNYCCDCLFGSNDHNHYYESLTSQEVTQLRSSRSREISMDNYQSIIDQASRSKLGDANVNASIVSTPPNNGLLINLKQSQAGYNYYTNSSTNAGISSIGSISSTGDIGVNVKGISSDLTQGSSTANVLAASAAVNTTATTTTSISAIDTNKNASLIQSIETIADDIYKTISNNINKNHTFSSIKNNRSNNISIISSDATVVSFKPFEDSSCIIHT